MELLAFKNNLFKLLSSIETGQFLSISSQKPIFGHGHNPDIFWKITLINDRFNKD